MERKEKILEVDKLLLELGLLEKRLDGLKFYFLRDDFDGIDTDCICAAYLSLYTCIIKLKEARNNV